MVTLVAIVLALTVLPSPWGVLAVLGGAAVDVAETVLLVRWTRRRRSAVGTDALIGRPAIVVRATAPEGQVRIDGELWRARAETVLAPGEEAFIVAVDGLLLQVAPVSDGRTSG